MTLGELLAQARDDPRIVGVVLSGSRGRSALVHEDSDWDVRVIVEDGEADFADSLDTPHGSECEVAATTLSGFRVWPEWDRYSYTHVQVLVDKLDGDIQRLVDAKGKLGEAEARDLVRKALGAYVNSLFRSLKAARLGLILESKLDAAESIASVLEAIFALEGRMRPFNKYLRWELERHPLENWDAGELGDLVSRALTGDADAQRRLFRAVEAVGRKGAYGDVFDDWSVELDFLRGVA